MIRYTGGFDVYSYWYSVLVSSFLSSILDKLFGGFNVLIASISSFGAPIMRAGRLEVVLVSAQSMVLRHKVHLL